MPDQPETPPCRCPRAASGTAHVEELLDMAQSHAPTHGLWDIAEVGRVIACLASPAAAGITGDTTHVDRSLRNMA